MALTALAGCGTDSGYGGMAFPVKQDGENYRGARRVVEGTVHRADNGCVFVEVDSTRYLTIWPAGTRQGDVVVLPGGDEVNDGARVRGTGALTPATLLTVNPPSQWSQRVEYCHKNANLLLVLDEVAPAE